MGVLVDQVAVVKSKRCSGVAEDRASCTDVLQIKDVCVRDVEGPCRIASTWYIDIVLMWQSEGARAVGGESCADV